MQYKTTCAVSIMGSRVEKNTVVDLDPKFAKNLGSDVVALEAEPEEEPEPIPEKSLEEMNHAELKEKAKQLDLKQSGSIADLRERITLHLEAEPEEEDEENLAEDNKS